MKSTKARFLLGAAAAVLLLAACGSDTNDSTSGSPDTAASETDSPMNKTASSDDQGASTDTADRPLRIMVTNDDGISGEGLGQLVDALSKRSDVEVVAVAPTDDRSGTGGSTLAAPHTATDATTTKGHPATAVAGFPADTVAWAIDEGGLPIRPDLVMSGINLGQNVGPLIAISGTVGAARAAATRGIPAVATSLGIGDPMQWQAAVDITMQWLDENMADIRNDDPNKPGPLWNLNIANCAHSRGIVVVEPATAVNGRNAVETACDSTLTDPTDDIDALMNGLAPLSELEVK